MRLHLLRGLALALTLAVRVHAGTPDDYYPADGGQVEVPCINNATADTAALKACVQNSGSNFAAGYQVCRLPAGTCRLNDQIAWKDAAGNWISNLSIVGRGATQTFVVLENGAAGFQSAANYKPLFYMASKCEAGDPAWCFSTGGFNKAFGNMMSGINIDTGNNPGAVGIDLMASNWGGLRNIRVHTSYTGQLAGIHSNRSPGPSLLQDVQVTGDYVQGLILKSTEYSTTIDDSAFERTYLHRHVLSSNWTWFTDPKGGPAITIAKEGDSFTTSALALTNPFFYSGGTGGAAVSAPVYFGVYSPQWYRKVQTVTGYANVVPGLGAGGTAYVPLVQHAFAADAASALGVDGVSTPGYPGYWPANSPSDWQKAAVNASDALDDSAAIQTALNSGKAIIYVPSASAGGPHTVRIGTPLTVPSTVKAIHFMKSTVLNVAGTFADPNGIPAITISSGSDPLYITGAWVSGDASGGFNALFIRNNSGRQVILLDSRFPRIESLSGRMHAFNVAVEQVVVRPGAEFYARQLDCEGVWGPGCLTNIGGKVNVLGFKWEGGGRVGPFHTSAGGCTQIDGALIYPIQTPTVPMITQIDSHGSYGGIAESSYGPLFSTWMSETRSGVTQTINAATAIYGSSRGAGAGAAALISAHVGACPL